MKAIFLGVLSSFFFAFAFIFNRQMNLSGGSWIWGAALRYLFMLPLLFSIIIFKKSLNRVLDEIKKDIKLWILWSTIGFGVFYAPLSFAAAYGPSWLVASTWQVTIVAGTLLTPFLYKGTAKDGSRKKIPLKALAISGFILLGIFIMQIEQAVISSPGEILIGVIPVVIGAFAYPLGNRKMMEICENKLNALERVFGMTLCSMPFWIILSCIGVVKAGTPSNEQMLQALIVAVCSGVIATIMFFKATDMVKADASKLAAVEATQAGEVIFTILGELLIVQEVFPSKLALIGMVIVVIGMIMHSLASRENGSKNTENTANFYVKNAE